MFFMSMQQVDHQEFVVIIKFIEQFKVNIYQALYFEMIRKADSRLRQTLVIRVSNYQLII